VEEELIMNQNGKYGKKWCVCGSFTEKSVIYRFFGKAGRFLSAQKTSKWILTKKKSVG
jgi:hypothetical protein